jgi:hypothetical protein
LELLTVKKYYTLTVHTYGYTLTVQTYGSVHSIKIIGFFQKTKLFGSKKLFFLFFNFFIQTVSEARWGGEFHGDGNRKTGYFITSSDRLTEKACPKTCTKTDP